MSIYSPAVACFGPQYTTGISEAIQQRLLSQISVDTERHNFGAEGEPGVQVVVPVTYSVPATQGEYGDPNEVASDSPAVETR